MSEDEIVVIDETDTEIAAPASTVQVDVQEGAKDDVATLPDGAVVNPDGSVTLSLLYPKSVSIRSSGGAVREERFSELTFRRLNGADLNAFRATAQEHQGMVLFARSTRIAPPIMRALFTRLDAADITRGGKVIDTFF